jgi:hypothetical protein
MREMVPETEVRRGDDRLRRKRRQALVYRRRRIRLAVGFTLFCLLVAGVVVALSAGGSNKQVSAQTLLAETASSPLAPVAATGEERPAFVRLKDRNLLLPVAARNVTVIAYQPLSDSRAVPFTPIGEQLNANALVRFFRNLFSGEPAVRYYLLDGGKGEPTSSVLVGAPPGSPVTAPVSGIVTAVKQYKLYGKYEDVQIDIRPEEMSSITLTLLFIDEPAVTIGEVVTAGKTQLGKVRECPEQLGAALSPYTHDSGSHVYMQATEEPIN